MFVLRGQLSKALRLSVMPPKRTASTSKRKASSPLSDDDVSKTAKKSKVSAATSAARYSDQPTNKVLPVNISFPQKVPDTLRFATWNIAGLAASHKKGFKYYVEAEEPDILVLTETKVRAITRFLACQPHPMSGKQCASGSSADRAFSIRTLDDI
jgi:hypothetical protein